MKPVAIHVFFWDLLYQDRVDVGVVGSPPCRHFIVVRFGVRERGEEGLGQVVVV